MLFINKPLENDTTLFSRLIQNMQDSLPAHLAIVDESNTTGHNVVVDGYNTNNYFHVNFGWGGSSNGWYLLPDEMPLSLTVIEGLIVDIMKHNYASTPSVDNDPQFEIYPNPAADNITIIYPKKATIEIINIEGQILKTINTESTKTTINLENLPGGVYIIKATSGRGVVIKKFVKE